MEMVGYMWGEKLIFFSLVLCFMWGGKGVAYFIFEDFNFIYNYSKKSITSKKNLIYEWMFCNYILMIYYNTWIYSYHLT